MTSADEIINKSRQLLIRLEKIGVGIEGGVSAEHQTGGFGYTDETIPEDDFYMPEDALSEDNCKLAGNKCAMDHDEKRTTRQVFSTGDTAQAHIGQDY